MSKFFDAGLKNAALLDNGGAVTQKNLVLDSEGQPGIRPPTNRQTEDSASSANSQKE